MKKTPCKKRKKTPCKKRIKTPCKKKNEKKLHVKKRTESTASKTFLVGTIS